jgi:hypothetical protein
MTQNPLVPAKPLQGPPNHVSLTSSCHQTRQIARNYQPPIHQSAASSALSFVMPPSSQRVQRHQCAQQQPLWANTRRWSYGCQCARVRDAIEMLDSGSALIGACVRVFCPEQKVTFPDSARVLCCASLGLLFEFSRSFWPRVACSLPVSSCWFNGC